MILAQLTSLLDDGDSVPNQFAAAAQARSLSEELFQHGPSVLSARGLSLVTAWCPADAGVLGRLLAAYGKHVVETVTPLTLWLVTAGTGTSLELRSVVHGLRLHLPIDGI